LIKINNFDADAYDKYRTKNNLVHPNPVTSGDERETFTEYVLTVFSDDIKLFIARQRDEQEYINFIRGIFGEALGRGPGDPVWKLIQYLENESDFFYCPASAKFHSNEQYGLVRHSLNVLANGIKLAPVMLSGEIDMYYLIVSCLFHDLCKVNMYEMKTRNIKNEETGSWEKAPYYRVSDSYISYGHGIESLLRLNKYIAMPDAWNQAIRWHMGAFDQSPLDKYAMDKAMAVYREVLFLHTADMLSSTADETQNI